MPYYNVQIVETVTKHFIVCAPNRDGVEEILAAAIVAKKCDNKKIINLQTNSDSGLSVYDAKKSDWTEALKQTKAK